MKDILQYFLASVFLLGLAFSEENKLIFVEILVRHGDRAPIFLYPNDPNNASVWSEGLESLTTLGKKQQYALGKYFRARYDNFTTSSPLEVSVLSSEADRCLKSAETNLASFYAPDHKWSFENNLSWQPIAIHYIPKNQDKYFALQCECPQADKEMQNVMKSPEVQKIVKEHEAMFRNLSILSGYNITNWRDAYDIYDVLFIEKKYNLSVPTWVEPYWNELTSVANKCSFWEFNSTLLHRLKAGPLIQKIIERMNQKINGDIPNLKFQIYSAEDLTIDLVLIALNLFNMISPPYSSALLFELFEMPDGVKTVRLLYQNSSKPEEKIDTPHILILNGCTEFCPLDYFIKYTSHLIPEDWDKECQLDKTFFEKIEEQKLSIGWFLILIAVQVSVASAFVLWRIYSRRQNRNFISAVKYHSLDGS